MPLDHPCDICGSTEAVEVPHVRLYTREQAVHICRCCGFVHVRTRRTAQEVADAWSDEMYGNAYTARIPAVLARQTYVAEFMDVELGLAGKSVLDIGAGEAQFLEILRDRYKALPFGVEPSQVLCQRMRDIGFQCFQGTMEEYAASNDPSQYDVATLLWTLENCTSCRDLLDAAHAALKPGGHVVVATGSRIMVPFKKTMHAYFTTKPEEPDYFEPVDNHCFHFSANSLRAVLAVCGFRTTSINRFHDTDYLVVIARKEPQGADIPWKGDNFLAVHDFFDRWHRESMHYLNPPER